MRTIFLSSWKNIWSRWQEKKTSMSLYEAAEHVDRTLLTIGCLMDYGFMQCKDSEEQHHLLWFYHDFIFHQLMKRWTPSEICYKLEYACQQQTLFYWIRDTYEICEPNNIFYDWIRNHHQRLLSSNITTTLQV